MDSARTLYSILNIIIFLLIAAISLGVLFFAIILLGFKQEFLGIDEGLINYRTESMLYVYTILRLGVYFIFIRALWKMKKVTKYLLQRNFYDTGLITSLFTSGKLMVSAGLFYWIINVIADVFFKVRVSIGLSEKTIVYLSIIALGLFLMLMSTVLKDTKVIKEENDLTI